MAASTAAKATSSRKLNHKGEYEMPKINGKSSKLAILTLTTMCLIGLGLPTYAGTVLICEKIVNSKDFSGCFGSGRDLSKLNFRGANFSGAVLRGAILPSNLQGANFSGAYLNGTNFSGKDLRTVNFTGADLGAAKFAHSDLSFNQSLVAASLQDTSFAQVKLLGANLAGSNLRGSDLKGANLSHANLSGASLISADLRRTSTKLVGTNFYQADLTGALLDKVDLSLSLLSNVKSGLVQGSPKLPKGWTIAKGYLVGPTANLQGADLSKTNLLNVDLAGANLSGVNLFGAKLGISNSGKKVEGFPAKLPTGWKISKGVLRR